MKRGILALFVLVSIVLFLSVADANAIDVSCLKDGYDLYVDPSGDTVPTDTGAVCQQFCAAQYTQLSNFGVWSVPSYPSIFFSCSGGYCSSGAYRNYGRATEWAGGALHCQCFNWQPQGTSCGIGSCPVGTAKISEDNSPPASCDGVGSCNLLTDDNLRLFCKETDCINGLNDNKDLEGKIDAEDISCTQEAIDASCIEEGSASKTIGGLCCVNKYVYSESFNGYDFATKQLTAVQGNIPLDSENLTIGLNGAGFTSGISSIIASLDSLSHSGKKSLKIVLNRADAAVSTQTIELTPGSYTLSAYVRGSILVLNSDTSAGYPQLAGKIITISNPSADVRPITQIQATNRIIPLNTPTTFDWQKVEFTFDVPKGKTIFLLIGSNWGLTTGTLWVDDIKITRNGKYAGLSEVSEDDNDLNYVCMQEEEGWKWKSATSSPYQIMRAGDQFDILSNSAKWFSCSPGFNLDWVDNPISGALEEELETIYDFEEEPLDSSTYTYSETESEDIRQQEINQEDILSDIEGERKIEPEEPVYYSAENGYKIYVQPKIVTDGILRIRVENSEKEFEIMDASTRKIKIGTADSQGEINWIELKNENAVSVEGIAKLAVRIPSNVPSGNYHLNISLLEKTSAGNAVRNYVAEGAFSVAPEFIVPNFLPFNVYPGRFFCSYEGGNSETQDPYAGFTECCGPSYASCFNDKAHSRIAGGPISLIKDYGTPLSGNIVLRAFFPRGNYELYRYSLTKFMENPLPITKWSTYDNLEFDIFFAGNRTQNLRIKITDNLDNVLFDDLAIKYSISGNMFQKWHHVVIPLTPNLKSTEVGDIVFYSMGNELEADVETEDNTCPYCLRMNDIAYLMIFGLDRFFLSVNGESNATLQDVFCASNYDDYEDARDSGVKKVGSWIDDIDTNMDACNNVASYKWTAAPYENDGNKINCCGDDQSKTSDETYYNNEGACWRGMYIGNDTVVDVSVNLTEIVSPVSVSAVCGDGITASTEICDDGNTASGDGCSASCTVEAGYTCLTNIDPSECVVMSQ